MVFCILQALRKKIDIETRTIVIATLNMVYVRLALTQD